MNCVTDNRLQDLCILFVLLENSFKINLLSYVESFCQRQLIGCEVGIHFIESAVDQISHTDATTSDFVFIAGADPAGSGSNRNPIRTTFRNFFHHAVEGEDHMSPV